MTGRGKTGRYARQELLLWGASFGRAQGRRCNLRESTRSTQATDEEGH